MFTIPLNDLLSKLPKPLPHYVLLQLPEGLKPQANRIVDAIESASEGKTVVFVSGDPCYGACDLADDQAKRVGAELIIQIGHTPFGVGSQVPVIYYPLEVTISIDKFIEDVPSHLVHGQAIGLATTTQHLPQLPDFQTALEENKFDAWWGPGSGRVAPGQVLGCDYTTCIKIDPPVDLFLFIGTGFFHPLGIAFSTGKPVYAYDPATRKFASLNREYRRHRRKRLAAITEAKKAEIFGVIVSTKPGQAHPGEAQHLRQLIQSNGRTAVIIVFREIQSDRILNFSENQAYVVTACPRVAIDDQSQHGRPILTPQELEVALEIRGFNDVYPAPPAT